MRSPVVFLLLAGCLAGCVSLPRGPLPERLTFAPCAGAPRVLGAGELGPLERVSVEDPVYKRRKSYEAHPLRGVLQRGFPGADVPIESAQFRLIAADGYTKTASGALLLDGTGFLAVRDAERPAPQRWEPLADGQDPGPFYVVWTGTGTGERPWPYQLIRVEQSCPAPG